MTLGPTLLIKAKVINEVPQCVSDKTKRVGKVLNGEEKRQCFSKEHKKMYGR
jgi:hypothetical protein